jgi:integral membrane sensor domain MASE1
MNLQEALFFGFFVYCFGLSLAYTMAVATGRPVWQPRSWRFMLLRTLKALPQPACVQRNGFSPV